MRLSQYLTTNDLSQAEFRRLLNAARPDGAASVTAAAVSQYTNGIRSPWDELKSRIFDLTGGAVDGNSWINRDPQSP